MKPPLTTSLPKEIGPSIRDGSYLVGDDFNEEQLALWFAQEREAFYEGDAGNSEEDPWYAYMRYVNDRLGFLAVLREPTQPKSMLVLGPGSGKEVEQFARSNPGCKLNFVEASKNFQSELCERFPGCNIVIPCYTGEINLDNSSQDIVCAFSVLHHIPNVSRVLAEVGRVTRPGGLLMVREPCSSMGDWRKTRSATPNERGISRKLMVQFAERAGFGHERRPTPIIFEPINKILKKTIGFSRVPFGFLYFIDHLVSGLLSVNDRYWRESWPAKLGPSSYFYLFRRKAPVNSNGTTSYNTPT